jgi:uncharacterized protein (DUF111 family)
VALGSGWIDIAHGRFPVPAPATLRILEGIPTTGLDLIGECTTPTGAAIIATLTGGALPPDAMAPGRTGFGAGTRDSQDRPNCLRLLSAEVDPASPAGEQSGGTRGGQVFIMQADIDDMSAEYVSAALDALIAAGARDAVALQIVMKKGRLGHRIEAVVDEGARTAVAAELFRATSTIGLRFWPAERDTLERSAETREWQGHRIAYKRVTLPDGTSRSKPEYDDVAKAAAALGRTPFQVRQALDQLDDRDGGPDGGVSQNGHSGV